MSDDDAANKENNIQTMIARDTRFWKKIHKLRQSNVDSDRRFYMIICSLLNNTIHFRGNRWLDCFKTTSMINRHLWWCNYVNATNTRYLKYHPELVPIGHLMVPDSPVTRLIRQINDIESGHVRYFAYNNLIKTLKNIAYQQFERKLLAFSSDSLGRDSGGDSDDSLIFDRSYTNLTQLIFQVFHGVSNKQSLYLNYRKFKTRNPSEEIPDEYKSFTMLRLV